MTTYPSHTIPARAWCGILLAAVLMLGACRTVRQGADTTGAPAYKIIAYVGGRADIHSIDARKLTHVNYAFGHVSPEGDMIFENPNSPSHIAQLQALKAKNPDLKILVSIGGWGADNFSDAALTEASRDKFTQSGMEMVKRYALDGLDLDWEYPGQPGPGIKYRPEDKQNFTLMLKDLREALDSLSDARGRTGSDRYLLTIASAAGRYFEHTEMDVLHTYLDWINIMAYDMFTSGSERTGHHTGLYPSGLGFAPERTTESYVEQHLNAGIPPEKLVIGAAFYGRSWTGVNPEHNGLNQSYDHFVDAYSYDTLQRDYINKRSFQRYWDDAARAPYLWSPDSTTFISYDDPESLRHKALFVKQHGLGGIMFWEYSHDPREVLLSTLYESLK